MGRVWGVNKKAVSGMLGHADVGITLKIYHHVNSRAIREMHSEYSPVIELEAVDAMCSLEIRDAVSHNTISKLITILHQEVRPDCWTTTKNWLLHSMSRSGRAS